MKMKEIQKGHCYKMEQSFQAIECVKADMANSLCCTAYKDAGAVRPFYCIEKDERNNIVWLAPLSTKYTKYAEVRNQKLRRNGFCDDIVFTFWNEKNNVILLQNAFPVTPNYVKEHFIKGVTGNIYGVNRQTQNIINKFWGKKKAKMKKGIITVFPHINEYLKFMRENDYRLFSELSPNERREVVTQLYPTEKLKRYENIIDASNIVPREEEICRIMELLMPRKDITFNPHLMTKKEQVTYQFGNTAYKTLKGKRTTFIACKTASETLSVASLLETSDICYRGVINEDNTGQIKILYEDEKRYQTALEEPAMSRKALGNISLRQAQESGCVRFKQQFSLPMVIRIANMLWKENIRYRIDLRADSKGFLACYKNDVTRIKELVNNEIAKYRKEKGLKMSDNPPPKAVERPQPSKETVSSANDIQHRGLHL